jgi:hypothetical protein
MLLVATSDRLTFTCMDARHHFADYLEKNCPMVLELLKPAGRYLDRTCLFYRFIPKHRQNFENLSESPLVDFLARAAMKIKLNISIKIKDLETEFEHEILIRRTPDGLEAVRNVTDGKQRDFNNKKKPWLRPVFYG